MAERIVINTGPLIALTRMDALDIAGQLPYEFLCPSAVQAELEAGAKKGHPVVLPSWLYVQPSQGPLSPLVIPPSTSERRPSFNWHSINTFLSCVLMNGKVDGSRSRLVSA